ncbi:NUDIX domain-containing protein [Geomonas subterranea]|uniref:NUDIX domain-containing protein n=1 Tax=Geomonas subterranea TaxID=2847989 RepID=A0ABX8LM46_9BACT|nr:MULTISPECIES: NUDIX domain-containing protein [Geomonas]QXE93123.1 NUDIX domain-containing protein [Geomonas subterranea]QXM11637.1 NUDIX domain-containing protein [Geomonas subterranea]
MEQNGFKASHIVTSVVAVIIDSDGRVLLTKRNIPPFQGEWVMPGGKIDLGEPIVAALKREVWEEVGLEVEVGELIDVFEHVTPGEAHYHFIIIYYRCTPLYCDVKHNQDEVAEARWVEPGELPDFKIPAGARFILSKIFTSIDNG